MAVILLTLILYQSEWLLPYLIPDQKTKLSHIITRSCLYNKHSVNFDGETVALSFDPFVECIKLNIYIYYCIYYDVFYLCLLDVISQNEIMIAAASEGYLDKVKEALNNNANINAKEPYVSYSFYSKRPFCRKDSSLVSQL